MQSQIIRTQIAAAHRLLWIVQQTYLQTTIYTVTSLVGLQNQILLVETVQVQANF